MSGANEYSVKPLPLVSPVAPPILAVLALPAATAVWALVPADEEELPEEPPDEPHAASTATAAAAAGSASISRGRLIASSRASDLIIAFSLAMAPRAPAPGGR